LGGFWLRPIAILPQNLVLRILLRRIFAWQRRQARQLGVDDPRPAAVSFLPLFGSALNLHPHSHSLLPDAVFWQRRVGAKMEIVPLLAPTDEEVETICAQVARRVLRVVAARLDAGVELKEADVLSVPVSPPSLPLPWARRDEAEFEHPADRGRRCAEVEGFSLHAAIRRSNTSRYAATQLLKMSAICVRAESWNSGTRGRSAETPGCNRCGGTRHACEARSSATICCGQTGTTRERQRWMR
jgi:hypothetical protein